MKLRDKMNPWWLLRFNYCLRTASFVTVSTGNKNMLWYFLFTWDFPICEHLQQAASVHNPWLVFIYVMDKAFTANFTYIVCSHISFLPLEIRNVWIALLQLMYSSCNPRHTCPGICWGFVLDLIWYHSGIREIQHPETVDAGDSFWKIGENCSGFAATR